jgi:hypothetical protein
LLIPGREEYQKPKYTLDDSLAEEIKLHQALTFFFYYFTFFTGSQYCKIPRYNQPDY